jgi:hypothetical protein
MSNYNTESNKLKTDKLNKVVIQMMVNILIKAKKNGLTIDDIIKRLREYEGSM